MEKPKVTVIREQNTFNTAGTLQKSYIVSFDVGTHGPFTVTVPGDQFNAANVQKRMQEVADQINQLTESK